MNTMGLEFNAARNGKLWICKALPESLVGLQAEASIWFENRGSWVQVLKLDVSWVLKFNRQSHIAQDWENHPQNFYLIVHKSFYFWKCSQFIFLHIIGFNRNNMETPRPLYPKIWGSRNLPNPWFDAYAYRAPAYLWALSF